MLLHHAAWPEVEAYLTRSNGILMPIGSTEQHGPNGLVGTDALCAEIFAKAVGEAAEALVGPTISVGMAVHHMNFPGSMTLRPSTLIQVIQDYVLSLARHGFRRFFFLNGHGGNIATVQAAFYEDLCRRRRRARRRAVEPWRDPLQAGQLVGFAGDRQAVQGDLRRPGRQPCHRLRSRRHAIRLSGNDQARDPRSAQGAERAVLRPGRLPPELPGRPHRLESRIGDAGKGQADRRGGGAGPDADVSGVRRG